MYLVPRVFPLRKWKKPWERGCKNLVSPRIVLERVCPSDSQNRSRSEAELQPRRNLIFFTVTQLTTPALTNFDRGRR